MKPPETSSMEKSKSAKKDRSEPPGNKEEATTEPNSELDGPSNIDPRILNTIDDEILRLRIRRLADEKPSSSAWQRFSANPLVPIVLGFLLSGLLGGFVTNYYNLRQKQFELQYNEAQRKSEQLREDKRLESDRIREVWEKIYETEPKIDRLVEKIIKTPSSFASDRQYDVKRVNDLMLEQENVIKKNIFSIRPEISDLIREYDNINREYATDKILGAPEKELSEALKKREQTKEKILENVRRLQLEKETASEVGRAAP